MNKDTFKAEQKTPHFYGINFTLTNNQQLTAPLILDQDSEFDLYGITAVTDQDGTLAADATPVQLPENFSLLIQNQTTARQFMNIAIRRGNICGVAFANFVAEGARIRFPRKNQFSFTVQNLVAATITVQIVLKGYKVYSQIPGA